MSVQPILIAPSLLACDFTRIAEELGCVEAAGADWHHLDVMDGHFVPNLTIGPPVVARIHEVAKLPLDVHLMIMEPLRFAGPFARAGADVLTFHIEVTPDDESAQRVIDGFRAEGIGQVGVALNPDTPVERLKGLLNEVDLVLVMSVFPGFGGQEFTESVLPKVRWLREQGYRGHIEMDGGLDSRTIPLCAAAGTNVLVAGTAIYGAPDRGERIASLRAAAERARG